MITTLFLLVSLVILSSAICSGTEAALFSIPLVKVKQLAEAKVRGAVALLKIQEKMNRPIAMIVILNNIANIVGSTMIGFLAARVFGSEWVGLFSAVLTLLVIIFAEIIPKTIGEKYSEAISLKVATPVLFLTACFLPLIWLIEFLTNPFTKNHQPQFTTNEKEIRYLAQIGDEEGAIEHDEFEMIKGVFQLNDLTAKDLMTPRTAMTSLKAELTILEAKQQILDSQHSRIVITGKNRDEVVGVALRSKLLASLVEKKGETTLDKHTVAPLFVTESTQADRILPLFQNERLHLAIVLDDFGGVAGVITLEDVIEELTGEIIDETDKDEDMRKVAEEKKQEPSNVIHQKQKSILTAS